MSRVAACPLRVLRGAAALLMGLALAGEAGAQAPAARDTLDVLFVGNSYTYYHNLPEMVEALSRAVEGPVIRARAHTHGGVTLSRHVEDGHVAEALERGPPGGGRWSRVVLQEQSQLGTELADRATGVLGDPGPFLDAAEALAASSRAVGARPLLYMTWARAGFPGQTSSLADAYARAAARTGAEVAPVGLAWARVRAARPDLELYREDGSHPSAAGSYLAACVLYAVLAGRSPEGGPERVEGGTWDGPDLLSKLRHLLPLSGTVELVSLEPGVAGYLQRVAWETVQAYRAGAATSGAEGSPRGAGP